MTVNQKSIQEILDSVALRYRGPGGAVAILKNGEVVGQRVWGFADINKQIPLTAQTQMPICSITKQFVCALLLDLYRNPTPAIAAKGDPQRQFTDKLSELLRPEIANGTGLTIEHLCDMQSGLRDYWAMTTLWGAQPDAEFLIERDCPPALERTRSFHFTPGAEYSYCNVNFHILARVIERVTGEPLDKLLADRLLGPAGMKTAVLCPNTTHHPPPCEGYEGDELHGYQKALNRMEWSGDAGLVASLTDMVAWEKYLEQEFANPESWYHTICQNRTFSDGNRAIYHYGMSRRDIDGVATFGHGGALRGYRLQRSHAPEEHLSVVAMFNHEAGASSAVDDVMRAILNKPAPRTAAVEPSAEWFGTFLDQDTQLAIRVTKSSQIGEVLITYAGHLENDPLRLIDSKSGQTPTMVGSIDGDRLRIHRIIENRTLDARRLLPNFSTWTNTAQFLGLYECAEAGSLFRCSGDAGMLYGAFEGYLGCGPASPMRYLGDDVWAFTCPRGLDAPAPGDWTMVFRRDNTGAIVGFRIGCWLARGLEFVKSI